MTPDRNKNFQLAQIFPLLMSFRIHNTLELHSLQCLHLYHRPTTSTDQTFQIKIKEQLLICSIYFNTTGWRKLALIYSNQTKEIEIKTQFWNLILWYRQVCSADDTSTRCGDGRYLRVAIKKISRPFQSAIHAKRTYRELRMLKHMNHENVRGRTLLFSPLTVLSRSSAC